MSTSIDSSAFDRATQPIFCMLTPEQVHQIAGCTYHSRDSKQVSQEPPDDERLGLFYVGNTDLRFAVQISDRSGHFR